jgi:hypothetical protein
MSKLITFSLVFPGYHPRAGQPTRFVEKIWKGLIRMNLLTIRSHLPEGIDWHGPSFCDSEPKYHTIRAGHRWKVGDKFSPRHPDNHLPASTLEPSA